MRNRAATVLAVPMIILTVTFSTWAKLIPPRPFYLERDVTMNGAIVPHGLYNLTVNSDGSSVRATLWKDGSFVATAHGMWVKHGVKYSQNAVLLRVNSDGSRTLSEIRLEGSTKTIVLDNNSPLRVEPSSVHESLGRTSGTAN